MQRSLPQIIEFLGGWQVVADEFGCGQSAISNWKARGVPSAKWLAVARFAATRDPPIKPPITAEEIEAASIAQNAAYAVSQALLRAKAEAA
jgi:hypothetical protein